MEKYQLPEFAVPISHCGTCSGDKQYQNIDHAYRHLLNFHVQKNNANGNIVSKEKLGHWLVLTAGLTLEKRNTEMINLLDVLNRRTKKLLYKAIEIRNSVANVNNEKPSNYLLLANMVKAAEKVFQYVYTSRYTVEFLHDQSKILLNPHQIFSPIVLRDNIALAEYYGIDADNCLSRAQDELLLMAHTGTSDGSSLVRYTASPPETTILFGIICLLERPLHQDTSVVDLYRAHLASLVS